MSKEILTFGDIETEKNKSYGHESPILKKDVDIEKVLVSNMISFGEKSYKFFIGHLYNDYKVKSLHVILPKQAQKLMYFLIDDEF